MPVPQFYLVIDADIHITQITLDEVGTGFAFTVSAVLANRLLIAVREKYYSYRKELDECDSFTTMRFQTIPAPPAEETIALETFEDATMSQSRWDGLTSRGGRDYGFEQYSEARGF